MKRIRTDKRIEKIKSVISARQYSLKIALENIHDPHNVSAIFRTCDAAGIPKVSLIYNLEPFPKIGKKSSASAFKWVEKEKFKSVKECYQKLKDDGFKIYASSLSDEAIELADKKFLIPMHGMVQSLNVSVSAAIVIYEALRQRKTKGMYDKSEISKKLLDELVNEWSEK